MAPSGRNTDPGSIESWAGHGVRVTGRGPVEVVIAPRLLALLRRHVASMRSLSDEERSALRDALARVVRAVGLSAGAALGPTERAEIDELLRRAGLPPLAP